MPGNTTQYSGLRMQQLLLASTATNKKSYVALGRFIFEGVDYWGEISKIQVIAYCEDGVPSFDVKVSRVSDGLTIAEATGMTNTSPAIIDLGVVSNLPATSGVFEVQAQRSGTGAKNLFVDAVALTF